jgi:hypothetical protein
MKRMSEYVVVCSMEVLMTNSGRNAWSDSGRQIMV